MEAISGIDIVKLANHGHGLSIMVFLFNQNTSTRRIKRMNIEVIQQQQAVREEKYLENHCHIRTRNNQGHPMGDLLLIAAENIRNPFLSAVESIYTNIGEKREIPEAVIQLLEIINSATDVILAIFTKLAYPIIKYASAKALKSIGHVINNDIFCLKNEFSPQEIANLLYDTDGISTRSAMHGLSKRALPGYRPAELTKVKPFKPEGSFVHEDISTHIHCEKYILVDYKNKKYQVIEKQQGQYYLFDPKAVMSEIIKQNVYFDQTTNTIHLTSDMPADQGLEYTVVNGAHFIEIYGVQYEITYDKQSKTLMLVLHKPQDKIDFIPVYMEPLSKIWHPGTHNHFPVFTAIEKTILNNISVNIKEHDSYTPFPNTDPIQYGYGKIYRDTLFYRGGPYVEMNGKLVPLRQKSPLSKSVIAYEVFDLKLPEKQGYSIEWDGNRWIFEKVSSPHLSSELNRLLTPPHFEEKIDMRTLSAADSHGLRWNARNQSFLKVQYRYIKVNKLTSHRYTLAATPKHPRINLRFKHNFFVIETAEERLHWLSGASLSQRQKSPLKILKKQPNFNKATARALLSAYHFPDSGLFSEYAFVLDIEQTGRIPSWATPFEKNTVTQKRPDNLTETVSVFKLDTPNVTHHLNPGKQIATSQFGKIFLDTNNSHYLIKKYFDDMFIDPFIIGIYASQEADTLRHYYGSAANAFYTKNAKPYLQMYRIPGQTLASLPANSLPKTALERFVDMIEKLHNLGIQYGALRAEDIFWDPNSNTFYPISINNIEKIHEDKTDLKNIDQLDKTQANKIVEKIVEKIINK